MLYSFSMENNGVHTNLWWKNIVKINNKMRKKESQLQVQFLAQIKLTTF